MEEPEPGWNTLKTRIVLELNLAQKDKLLAAQTALRNRWNDKRGQFFTVSLAGILAEDMLR